MHRLACLVLATAAALLAWDVNDDLLDAARRGDLDTVKALIEKGAPIEAKTPYGQTSLYLAAMNGHDAVVQFLLDKGARTDIRDTFYKFPLLGFILERKYYAVAKLIVVKGDDNADDDLKAVADEGRADLVQAVLQKGKPSQPALDGAYEGALAENKKDVAELLKKAGAQEPAPPMTVDPKVLESYVGTFVTEEANWDIKVFVKEGKLYFLGVGGDAFAPKPKSPTVFVLAPADLEIDFDSATSFTLKLGARIIKFKKTAKQ